VPTALGIMGKRVPREYAIHGLPFLVYESEL